MQARRVRPIGYLYQGGTLEYDICLGFALTKRFFSTPSRSRGNTIKVPFPAASWANTFYRLSEYVTAERERKEGKGTETAHEPRAQSECSNHGAELPTPSDMLQQIAMYQEISSAPSEGSSNPVWKRRCVLLWTFSDIRDKAERVRQAAQEGDQRGGWHNLEVLVEARSYISISSATGVHIFLAVCSQSAPPRGRDA